jgi:3D (Asp-Asp-Asp) domain-containing protein
MKKGTALAIFITSFSVLATAYVPVLAGAEQKTIFLVENGKSSTYVTQALTVGEFFDEQGVELTPKDKSSKDYEEVLEVGTKIEIDRGFYVTALIDGKENRLKVSADTTVGALIAQLKKEKKMDFTYYGSLTPLLTDGQKILLTSRYESIDIEKIPIPFETQEVKTAELPTGEQQVEQEGKAGEIEKVTRTMYEGGVEQKREVISEEVTAEPKARIVKIGIGKAAEAPAAAKNATAASTSGEIKYSRVLTMSATAYTAGPESTGKTPGMKGYGVTASGMRVAHGVVAVDPRVIPLGTKLYVEGYGYSIAADTGSAIKGNKIDLYMDSLSAAYRWGRRTVTVYILK